MLYGYARVSSQDQSFDGQVATLQGAGCQKVYREKLSGKAAADRAQLQALMTTVEAGDVVVVTKLDRFGRNTRDLLNLIHDLEQRNVGFRSLGDSIDTTTPAGRLMMQMLAAIAEFERSRIAERCEEGRERARAEGRPLGRAHALNHHQRERAREMLKAGESQRSVARLLGVGQATIGRLALENANPA